MSVPRSRRSDQLDSSSFLHPLPSSPSGNSAYQDGISHTPSGAPNPTYAAFSPTTLSSTTPSATSAAKRRSTILVHQKSPLLLATPPQITRALAYSHPFILLLNKLVGLLSWTSGDPWESFLLLVVFWATVLYGDVVIRLAGPVVLVLMLIGGMYGRRFSPLSSSGRTEPGLGSGDGSTLGTGEGNSGKNGKKQTRQKNLSVDGIPDRAAKTGGSSTGTGGAKPGGHKRSHSAAHAETTNTRHQKTLDEMVETLREFTSRCNILLEPLLELTDFLSTQRTPTSATTRPALTALLVRILLCTPFWFALTLPPFRVITTRRVVLVFGTLVLAWHARVVRVARTILWRSASVRTVLALVTGMQFEGPTKPPAATVVTAVPGTPATSSATSSQQPQPQTPSLSSSSSVASGAMGGPAAKANGPPRESELTKALRRARGGRDAGVRFTFIIYENQRRWLGLGWTNSLFAYERAAWTDERNNGVPPKDQFELPEVEDGGGNNGMGWRWVEGSRWRVDGVPDDAVAGAGEEGEGEGEWDYDGAGGRMGWVYYDNKWQNGRRGQDGWGRWTRRRKWYRDAELVEVSDEDDSGGGGETGGDGEGGDNTNAADHGAPAASSQPRASEDDTTPTPEDSHPTLALTPSSSSTSKSSGGGAPIPTPRAVPTAEEGRRGRAPGDADDEPDDAVSLLSTSSRSATSSMSRSSASRRHHHRGGGSGGGGGGSRRGRRPSEPPVSEQQQEEEEAEAAAALSRQLGLGGREAGAGGGGGDGWGVGDEVRMGLE